MQIEGGLRSEHFQLCVFLEFKIFRGSFFQLIAELAFEFIHLDFAKRINFSLMVAFGR